MSNVIPLNPKPVPGRLPAGVSFVHKLPPPFALSIKTNNAYCRESCFVCAESFRADSLFEAFVDAGDGFPVCPECTVKINPVLARALDILRAQHEEAIHHWWFIDGGKP